MRVRSLYLCIGRIKDGFHQQNISASIQQTLHLLRIRLHQLVKRWTHTHTHVMREELRHTFITNTHSVLLMFLKSGLSTDGDTDSVLLVGPRAPATNRLQPANNNTDVTNATLRTDKDARDWRIYDLFVLRHHQPLSSPVQQTPYSADTPDTQQPPHITDEQIIHYHLKCLYYVFRVSYNWFKAKNTLIFS